MAKAMRNSTVTDAVTQHTRRKHTRRSTPDATHPTQQHTRRSNTPDAATHPTQQHTRRSNDDGRWADRATEGLVPTEPALAAIPGSTTDAKTETAGGPAAGRRGPRVLLLRKKKKTFQQLVVQL